MSKDNGNGIAGRLEELQAEHERWLAAIETRKAELAEAQEEYAGIVGKLIDAKPDERAYHYNHRMGTANTVGALQDELAELARRRDAALLARHDLIVGDMQRRATEAATEATEARIALKAALDAQLSWLNRGGRQRDDANDSERLAHDIAVAKARSAAAIAQRHAERAGRALQNAQAERTAARPGQ